MVPKANALSAESYKGGNVLLRWTWFTKTSNLLQHSKSGASLALPCTVTSLMLLSEGSLALSLPLQNLNWFFVLERFNTGNHAVHQQFPHLFEMKRMQCINFV